MSDLTKTYPCLDCAENCGETELPVFVSEYCSDAVVLELSEISELYIASIDPADKTKALGGPSDWTSKTSWESAISNTGAGKVRKLFGSGDVPEGEPITVPIHDGQDKVLNYNYVINYDIQSMTQENYTAMRMLQCGGNFRIWYMTRGGFLYGGQNGIPVNVRKATSPSERGKESYKILKFVFAWTAKCDPERIASPWSEPIVP